MSVPDRQLEIAQRARQDLDDILVWSRRHWGDDQAVAYATEIDAAIRRLLDFPEIGRKQDRIRVGLRSILVKRHLVYYVFNEPQITVLRILHERMDAAAHISP